MAAFGPTRLWLFWVNIRCFGGCFWRFRSYSGSLWQTPQSNQKALLLRSALAGSGPFAPGPIRAQRLRFASLHLRPLCLAAPDGRCAPTPGSIPALSLPMSLVRQDQKHSSFAHCKEWLEAWRLALVLWCGCPSPQPSPEGEGADFGWIQNLHSTRYRMLVRLLQTTRSVPSPSGRGLG